MLFNLGGKCVGNAVVVAKENNNNNNNSNSNPNNYTNQ